MDDCDILYAFRNLNHRFEELFESLSIMLIIDPDNQPSKTYLFDMWKQILHCNKDQIVIIYLTMSSLPIKEFFSSFSFDSSFNRLDTLHLDNFQSDILIRFLKNLSHLPGLTSFTISISDKSIDLTDVYQIILTLPALKSYKLFANGQQFSSLLPIATLDEQLRTIERLDIRNHCSFNDCLSIISHTPKLSHLAYIHTNPIDFNIQSNSSISTSKLTHLYIRITGMKFNIFEEFISKIHSKLEVLSFTTESEDITYLDANRWKRFLLKYYPQLKEFYLRCYAKHHQTADYGKVNQFLSLFWTERQWVFEAKIECTHILYSVEPYKYIEKKDFFFYRIIFLHSRKRWYESLPDEVVPSAVQLKKSSRVILTNTDFDQWRNVIHRSIKRILNLAQIYHLVIAEEKTFIGILIQIVHSLPELISLQLNSLSFKEPDGITRRDLKQFFSKPSCSKILNVYIEKVEKMGEVHFLSALCPRMISLQIISFKGNTDAKSFYL